MKLMEYSTCEICGSNEYVFLISRSDRYSNEIFEYVQCVNCGLIYLNPRPSIHEIKKYYPMDYDAFDQTKLKDIRSINNYSIQLNYVEKYYKHKGSLLDIGCGIGGFLYSAKKRGWRVQGIEPNPIAVEMGKVLLGVNILTGSLEDVQLPDNFFDVITLWDVIEHLHHPEKTLMFCNKLLRDNGWIFFSIPNINSFDRYMFGEKWIGWDAPRHLYLFNQEHIKKMLSNAGFNFVDGRCITGGRGSFNLSMLSILDTRGAKIFQKIEHILNLFLFPYRRLSYILKRGPIIFYAAKKGVKF